MKTFDRPASSVEPKPADESPHATTEPTTTEPTWKPLYRAGAVAALGTVACILIAVPIFLLWPPPGGLQPTSSTVIDCFALFQKNGLLGLLDLDLLMLVGAVLMVPLYLALYASLRRASPSWMAIALVLSLVGIAAYFTVNPAFSMFTLSSHYAAATSDAQRTSLVAAGQAILATYQGTGFDLYYLLSAIAMLIFAVVMLRSPVFGKTTAFIGIATGILMLVPPTVGTVGIYLSLVSLLPALIWNALLARRLFQLT